MSQVVDSAHCIPNFTEHCVTSANSLQISWFTQTWMRLLSNLLVYLLLVILSFEWSIWEIFYKTMSYSVILKVDSNFWDIWPCKEKQQHNKITLHAHQRQTCLHNVHESNHLKQCTCHEKALVLFSIASTIKFIIFFSSSLKIASHYLP